MIGAAGLAKCDGAGVEEGVQDFRPQVPPRYVVVAGTVADCCSMTDFVV